KIVDPFNLRELEEIIKEELAVDEPSLIIAQRPCALLKKANYTGYAIIDKDVCRNCKLCMSIACPAMVDKGDYIEIDDSLCNGCMLCAEKCPFDAIMKVGGNDE
ncbi:MAG: 4Fe-4S binding protein, partial [Halanaerobiaceae bacterium]|nr:4Fe-4S binding protein [Halanaerobiaceae bacterium]